jgi:hypothetical protein
MNVKLKADKKKFIFGDVEAAAEIATMITAIIWHMLVCFTIPKIEYKFYWRCDYW